MSLSACCNPDREVMVACNTLRTEIEHVMQEHGIERRVIWLESQLHNVPAKLKEALQSALDEVQDAERVLFGFGNCGNVVQGLVAGDFELIIPRIDDCISLVMGSQRRRERYSQENRAMYYTDGWMDKGHNVIDDYNDCVAKHGEEDAQDIFAMMYAHYETMAYLDTGLYDVEELMERTRFIGEIAGMQQKVEPATLAYVDQLVCGPWPDDCFVRVQPHESVPASPFLEPGSVLES